MPLALGGPLGTFLSNALGRCVGLPVLACLPPTDHPAGVFVVLSVLLNLCAFIGHILLSLGEVALVLIASTNNHLGSLQAAVLEFSVEVGDFVILRRFKGHAVGILLLVEDVMGLDMSSHITQEGEVLLSHVHCVADGIASRLLLQQQEGFMTIPVVLRFEVLDKLPAITTSCQPLQVIEEQLVVALEDGTTQLNQLDQQCVQILIFLEEKENELTEPLNNPEADRYTLEPLNKYLGATLLVLQGDSVQRAHVLQQQQAPHGKPIGKWRSNPIFDSQMYEVKFPDGSTDVMTTNLIAENLYSQIDKERETYMIMKEILDHQETAATVALEDRFVTSKNGQRCRQMTMAEWELKVRYWDRSTTWVFLKDLKIMNPVEIAKYTVANKIDDQPVFVWWVHNVLKKRDQIINKVRFQYWEQMHKSGIQLPHSVGKLWLLTMKPALSSGWTPLRRRRRRLELPLNSVRMARSLLPTRRSNVTWSLISRAHCSGKCGLLQAAI